MRGGLGALLLVFVSGCLCCAPLQDNLTATTTLHETPTTLITSSTGFASTSSTQGTLPTLEVTSTTSQPTTTSTLHEFDYSRLVVQLAGCDDDYWGNAMVAGYVTNTGSETAEAFTVVAYLKTEEGEVVDGGVKEISLSNLAPGESKSFSAVYTKSPAWKKCQAKIKELEVAS